MQEFFMDYGLWLLIALLVIIGIVFLLSGRRKADIPADDDGARAAPVERQAAPPAPLVSPPPPPPPATPVIAPGPVAAVEPEAVIPPVAEPAAAPVEAEPIPPSPAVTTPPDQPDDLLKLKGVGPKLNMLLIELGVTRFAQIAAWTDADIAAIDAKLGNFRGRPVRDQWVDQAKYLAAGDISGFEAKYGKL